MNELTSEQVIRDQALRHTGGLDYHLGPAVFFPAGPAPGRWADDHDSARTQAEADELNRRAQLLEAAAVARQLRAAARYARYITAGEIIEPDADQAAAEWAATLPTGQA